jgi:hypothetical protein
MTNNMPIILRKDKDSKYFGAGLQTFSWKETAGAIFDIESWKTIKNCISRANINAIGEQAITGALGSKNKAIKLIAGSFILATLAAAVAVIAALFLLSMAPILGGIVIGAAALIGVGGLIIGSKAAHSYTKANIYTFEQLRSNE